MKPTFCREVDGLVYRLATVADSEPVWQLLATQYYPRSPVCLCLSMEFPADIEASRQLIPGILQAGVSLVVEDSGRIIGASLACVERVEDGSQKHLLVSDPELAARYPKDSSIYRMFDQLTSSIDLFKRYGVRSAMAFKYLVVGDSHAGRGIAKRLVQFSLEVAKDFKLELAFEFTRSKYSEKIFESYGFDKLKVLHIQEYVDEVTGSRPFEKLDSEVLQNAVLYASKL